MSWKSVLGKTLGVPLFQEQAMRLAIEAAKFTPEEANGLRRSMATFKHNGDVGVFGVKFEQGMVARGYDPEFARRCFRQIEGFGSYGFPESHAISFAKLVYVSAWIKRWRPDVFCAAMLNSQPMGFYQPAQLVRDAREHGVEVRPVDAMASRWNCTLEGEETGALRPVRLGLRQIGGLKEAEATRLIEARKAGAADLREIAARAALSRQTLELLAEADALRALGMDRRQGLWAVKGLAPGGQGARPGSAAGVDGAAPGSALRPAGDGPGRPRGGGLPHRRSFLEGPPVQLLPHPARRSWRGPGGEA